MGKQFKFTLEIITQLHSITSAINYSPDIPFCITITRGEQKHLKS